MTETPSGYLCEARLESTEPDGRQWRMLAIAALGVVAAVTAISAIQSVRAAAQGREITRLTAEASALRVALERAEPRERTLTVRFAFGQKPAGAE